MPILGPQNTPKCNISQITAQKLRKTDVNHILTCLCKSLGTFDAIYIQQCQHRMELWPENIFFCYMEGLKGWWYIASDPFPSCHQCGGNVLRFNIRPIKCNPTQFLCIIFQILFKMGYLTLFKGVYLTKSHKWYLNMQHKFQFNDVIGYKTVLKFHIQLWKLCFLKLQTAHVCERLLMKNCILGHFSGVKFGH